jgi:preprotein translocase subunit SecD
MKTLKYIIIAILLVLIIFSCNSKLGISLKFIIKSQVPVSKEQLTIAKEVISGRLQSLQIKHFEIDQNDANAQLVVLVKDSANTLNLKSLLTSKGEISFQPVWNQATVISKLQTLDTKTLLVNSANVSDLLSLLHYTGNQDSSAIIGKINIQDTSLIFNYLNQNVVKNLFPGNLKFSLSATISDTHTYDLYAVIMQYPENSKSIQDASAITKSSTNAEISIVLNDAGSKLWKEISAQNLGKSVAILIDHKVYAAPKLRSEIGKSCIIAGNFNLNEARMLATILKNGNLPVPFQTVNQ